jgi:tRNA (cmo5U34)-methyltransferase
MADTLPQIMEAGDSIRVAQSRWSFGGEVPTAFETHAARSIPYYLDGHALIERVSDHFVGPRSICYDVGASTGRLLRSLAQRHPPTVRWIGLDCEGAMVRHAQSQPSPGRQVEFVEADACTFAYEPADLIVAYYTVQFVPPRQRQALINLIYESLNWGGAFLLFEKVRGPDARFQDIATALYTELKLENGYTGEEIVGKARSLKGVLEPFSTDGNLGLLRRAGFNDVMSIFKYVCFEGFLAIR